MNTTTLAAALAGFLLGGLTVSVAAQLEEDDSRSPHSGPTATLVVPAG